MRPGPQRSSDAGLQSAAGWGWAPGWRSGPERHSAPRWPSARLRCRSLRSRTGWWAGWRCRRRRGPAPGSPDGRPRGPLAWDGPAGRASQWWPNGTAGASCQVTSLCSRAQRSRPQLAQNGLLSGVHRPQRMQCQSVAGPSVTGAAVAVTVLRDPESLRRPGQGCHVSTHWLRRGALATVRRVMGSAARPYRSPKEERPLRSRLAREAGRCCRRHPWSIGHRSRRSLLGTPWRTGSDHRASRSLRSSSRPSSAGAGRSSRGEPCRRPGWSAVCPCRPPGRYLLTREVKTIREPSGDQSGRRAGSFEGRSAGGGSARPRRRRRRRSRCALVQAENTICVPSADHRGRSPTVTGVEVGELSSITRPLAMSRFAIRGAAVEPSERRKTSLVPSLENEGELSQQEGATQPGSTACGALPFASVR